jgi:hypothetical protein
VLEYIDDIPTKEKLLNLGFNVWNMIHLS